MNVKASKFATKTAFGLGVTFLLGAIIKLEDRAQKKIDDHYDAKSSEDSDQ